MKHSGPKPGRMRCLVAAACAAASLLCGCWGISPIERSGLVSLLAIDSGPGGTYRVTADILSPLSLPAPSPAGGDGGGNHPVLIRHSTATSLFAALRGLSAVSHLNIDFAHLQGIIVSEAIARQGLADVFESLLRAPEVSEVAPWLFVARGPTSAASVLYETESAVPYPGEVLTDLAEWAKERTGYQAIHAWGFLKQMFLAADAPVTAGLEVEQGQGTGKSAGFRLDGLGMFRGGQLTGWLQGGAATGWAVAAGVVREQVVVVPAPGGGSFTVVLHGARRRVRVLSGPDGPQVDLDVSVSAQLSDVTGIRANFWENSSLIHTIEGATAGVLRTDIASAISQAESAGTDIFGIGESVRLQDPAAWRVLGPTWSTSGFRRLAVRPVVAVEMADVGTTVCTITGHC